MTTAREEGLPASAVLAIATGGTCTFIDLYATQPLLPLFQSLFAVSKLEASLTVSAPTTAVALAGPLFGALATRTRRRAVIVPGLVCLGVATLLAATSRGLWDLVVWRFLAGVAISAIYVFLLAYVSEESSAADVGRAMAAFVTGNVVGGFFGRTIAGLMTERVGWREAFLALGTVNLIGAAVTWRWLPPSRRFSPAAAAAGRPLFDLGAHARALSSRPLLTTLAVGFNVLFCLVAAFTYVVFHLHGPPFALGTAALSSIFVVYLVGAVITPFSGPLIDRAGSRRVLVGCALVACVGMGLTLVPALPAVVAGLALACSSAFVAQSAATSYLRTAAPLDLRALASGLYVAAYYLGGSAGGVLPAVAWGLGGWSACVALVVATQLATLAVALRGWQGQAARPA